MGRQSPDELSVLSVEEAQPEGHRYLACRSQRGGDLVALRIVPSRNHGNH